MTNFSAKDVYGARFFRKVRQVTCMAVFQVFFACCGMERLHNENNVRAPEIVWTFQHKKMK